MWILLGLLAIVFTVMNLLHFFSGKDYRVMMALGLSFTAIELCSQYSFIVSWVNKKDWSAIEDVMPTMNNALWVLTIISIGLNLLPIFLEKRQKLYGEGKRNFK